MWRNGCHVCVLLRVICVLSEAEVFVIGEYLSYVTFNRLSARFVHIH